ncbi:MAG: hypothetical protein ACFCA4_12760 [Cyanophyceae cyanobacterium]
MDNLPTNLLAAKSRIRERVKLKNSLTQKSQARRRTRKEQSAEIRVTSLMDVPAGAIAKGFTGINSGVDTPTFQRSVPYAIGPSPCRCRPRPSDRPTPGRPLKGEVIFIYVSTGET